ncbi:hypothetical protein BZG36_01794 [Bifiguratus adelaidae]|uniref:18S rRNA factor 2 n=1 Tax=Bifiguratus adelaidae TaxID=1938954 RepID=A0A261Y293_9FUNG|nr:hypothetical protein BZG36_01794 [Bifiguratus adelaidae]
MASTMEAHKKALSNKTLGMKFMQRAQELELRQKLEQEREKQISEAHWVVEYETDQPPPQYHVEYEDSFLNLAVKAAPGRRSFQNFNTDIERTESDLAKEARIAREDAAEQHHQLSEREMTDRLNSISRLSQTPQVKDKTKKRTADVTFSGKGSVAETLKKAKKKSGLLIILGVCMWFTNNVLKDADGAAELLTKAERMCTTLLGLSDDSNIESEEEYSEEKKGRTSKKSGQTSILDDVQSGSDSEASEDDLEGSVDEEAGDARFQVNEDDSNIKEANSSPDSSKAKKVVKPLSKTAVADFTKAVEKTGVIYISRVPPFMKPQKMKHLLSQHGEVGRIYLAPEDPKVAARRKKYAHNSKKNYSEGWVEFMDKKVAKLVALNLNTKPIGGKRRNYHHDDLWNIKYLPKFKWHHLTERIAYERAAKQQRLRAELSQMKRENSAFVANVEKSKMIANMEEKRKKRQQDSNEDSVHRQFKQRKTVEREDPQAEKVIGGKTKKVLSRIFGK